ncbi:MAG: hypothetical protein M1827_004161 [Pycnora praestabilis]|nr:MAG: hypothetical protein M1827_004161 [Pycnora praestabilis]
MAVVPQKVLNWLYSVLTSEYYDINRTYSDVAQTLANHSSLSPRTDVYTYENGAPALLLHLNGTVPVSFRGTIYRFPIAIWVPHNYPREAPMVYVTPTQGMFVRPGQHVSGEGRVYHPYLAHWGEAWDKSTIIDFLTVLKEVFAKEPPVTTNQQFQRPRSLSQQRSTPPPLPPLPAELGSLTPRTPPSAFLSNFEARPPPPPPKPHENQHAVAAPNLDRANPSDHRPPPLPPLPGEHKTRQMNQAPQYRDNYASQSRALLHGTPLRASNLSNGEEPPMTPYLDGPLRQRSQNDNISPVSPISPQPGQGRQHPIPNYRPHQIQPSHAQPQPLPLNRGPPPPGLQYQSSPRHYPPYQQQPQPRVTEPTEPIVDLLSSSLSIQSPSQNGSTHDIIAPPIPPNPEKDALLTALSTTLRQYHHQSTTQAHAVQPSLHVQHHALQTAAQSLTQELQQLRSLDQILTTDERILHESMHEADHVISSAGTRSVPGVDEVLVAPTVVGGQLYELCAEEAALADILFVLGRGLDRGRVGGEGFVKQTRGLARERFLKKALIKKISRGMALTEDEWRG